MSELTFHDIIRIRVKLGMTQAEFAEEVGVTTVTINRWENEHARPSHLATEKLKKLGKKTGILI